MADNEPDAEMKLDPVEMHNVSQDKGSLDKGSISYWCECSLAP